MECMIKRLLLSVAILQVGMSGIFSAIIADGLSSEYLASDRWRYLMTSTSTLSNPAFLADEENLAVRTATGLIMNNAFQLFEADVAYPLPYMYDQRHAVGVSYAGEYSGEADRYSFDAMNNPVKTGTMDYNINSFTLGYGAGLVAVPFLKNCNAGVNINFIHQTNFGQPLYDGSIDAGFSIVSDSSWKIGEHRIGKHRMGISWMNIAGISRYATPLYTPYLRVSWLSGYPLGPIMNLSGGIEFTEKNLSLGLGKKNTMKAYRETDLAFRLGLSGIRDVFSVYALFGSGYWGAALQLAVKEKNFPKVHAGYQTLITENQLRPTYTFYVGADIKSREQLYPVGLYLTRLYNEALELYSGKNYWDAYLKFIELLTRFPNFVMNKGQVQYYASSCLENLGMRQKAIERYREALTLCEQNRECAKGHFAEKALTGMLRIYYRLGWFTEAKNIHAELRRKHDLPDSLLWESDYYLGEVYFQENNYDSAGVILSKVNLKSPLCIYARYTKAVIEYRTECPTAGDTSKICSKGKNRSIELLNDVIGDSAAMGDREKSEIEARAHLMLARLNFENTDYKEAVNHLGRIIYDNNRSGKVILKSRSGEEILECLAWSALKSNQWSICGKTAHKLREVSEDTICICQAALIEAFALNKQNKCTEALTVLKEVEPSAATLRRVDTAVIGSLREQRKNLYLKLDSLGEIFDKTARIFEKAYDSTGRPVNNKKPGENAPDRIIDSLRTVFEETTQSIGDNMESGDRATKWLFDPTPIDSCKELIPWTITKLMERCNKEQTEIHAIDKEIQKLQGQLDKKGPVKKEATHRVGTLPKENVPSLKPAAATPGAPTPEDSVKVNKRRNSGDTVESR